jgi:hypothetical protein
MVAENGGWPVGWVAYLLRRESALIQSLVGPSVHSIITLEAMVAS